MLWSDGPYYDPYYTTYGGVTVGYVSVMNGTDEVQITYYECDSIQIAEQYEVDMQYYATPSTPVVRSGRIILQVYSYNYDATSASHVLNVSTSR